MSRFFSGESNHITSINKWYCSYINKLLSKLPTNLVSLYVQLLLFVLRELLFLCFRASDLLSLFRLALDGVTNWHKECSWSYSINQLQAESLADLIYDGWGWKEWIDYTLSLMNNLTLNGGKISIHLIVIQTGIVFMNCVLMDTMATWFDLFFLKSYFIQDKYTNLILPLNQGTKRINTFVWELEFFQCHWIPKTMCLLLLIYTILRKWIFLLIEKENNLCVNLKAWCHVY